MPMETYNKFSLPKTYPGALRALADTEETRQLILKHCEFYEQVDANRYTEAAQDRLRGLGFSEEKIPKSLGEALHTIADLEEYNRLLTQQRDRYR